MGVASCKGSGIFFMDWNRQKNAAGKRYTVSHRRFVILVGVIWKRSVVL